MTASRMQKLLVASWTSHGGGKRRDGIGGIVAGLTIGRISELPAQTFLQLNMLSHLSPFLGQL